MSETIPEAIRPIVEGAVDLEQQLRDQRYETAIAVANLASYKAAVRKTVIENVRNGTICRTGANVALESWGDEPYVPRYDVRVMLEVSVTVEAEDEDDAREIAREAVYAKADDHDVEVLDRHVSGVEEISEY